MSTFTEALQQRRSYYALRPESWRLIAQLPFGLPAEAPGDKTFQPLKERLLIKK